MKYSCVSQGAGQTVHLLLNDLLVGPTTPNTLCGVEPAGWWRVERARTASCDHCLISAMVLNFPTQGQMS
jgi:hypothetical protein